MIVDVFMVGFSMFFDSVKQFVVWKYYGALYLEIGFTEIRVAALNLCWKKSCFVS